MAASLVQAEPGVSALAVLVVLLVLLVLVARLVPAEYLGQMLVGVRVLRTPADQTGIVELVVKGTPPILHSAKAACVGRYLGATQATSRWASRLDQSTPTYPGTAQRSASAIPWETTVAPYCA